MGAKRSMGRKTIAINKPLLDKLSDSAVDSDRHRSHYNLHRDLSDRSQRLLIAIEPGSYIQPHRHRMPPKEELICLLRGKGAMVCFDEWGEIEEIHPLDVELGMVGIEVAASVYHTIISLAKGSVFLEVKRGPFVLDYAKGFAHWAPEEGTTESGRYLRELESRTRSVFERVTSHVYGESPVLIDDPSLMSL